MNDRLGRILKDNHEIQIFEVAQSDGNHFEVDQPGGWLGVGIGVGFAMAVAVTNADLHLLLADADFIFFGTIHGVTKIKKQAFASHFQNIQSGPARSELQVASDVAARVDNFQVVIDESGGRRK